MSNIDGGTHDQPYHKTGPAGKGQTDGVGCGQGTSATEYIKRLVAGDMAAGSPQECAAAWFRENEAAISAEAEHVESRGVPGSHLALNHPWPGAEI